MRKILFCILASATFLAYADSNFKSTNKQGPYSVGLRVVQQYDYTRSYLGKYDAVTGKQVIGERARPIQTLVWYPAVPGGRATTIADYLQLSGSEDHFDRTETEAARIGTELFFGLMGGTIASQQVSIEKMHKMAALRDARSVSGKFPVLIYAPSFSSSAYENADLCEYLASQGYLVIASPNLGAHGRAMTHDLEGIEAQAGDIEYLIGYAQSMPQADMSHIAVLGYSWGGISNLFAAAKDSRITALVDLDGSVRYFPKLVQQAGYVVPERAAIPTLYLASQPLSIEEIVAHKRDVSDSFSNRMTYADFYKVTMNEMEHGNFASMFIRFSASESFEKFSTDEVSTSYSWMAQYVLKFLDAYLKNDNAALEFMRDTQVNNGVPKHLMTVEFRSGSGDPATQEYLAAKLQRVGFDHAVDVYSEMKAKSPDFVLDENALGNWAEQLGRTQKNDGIEIFKLLTYIYPKSPDGFEALGDAYLNNGNKLLALESYKHCLALTPNNERVKALIAKLSVNLDRLDIVG